MEIESIKAKLVVKTDNLLGECPLWSGNEMLWVDIDGKKFWAYDPSTAEVKTYDLPERPGSFAMTADNRLIFAFEKGLAYYEPGNPSSMERIADFELDIEGTRMNDGMSLSILSIYLYLSTHINSPTHRSRGSFRSVRGRWLSQRCEETRFCHVHATLER